MGILEAVRLALGITAKAGRAVRRGRPQHQQYTPAALANGQGPDHRREHEGRRPLRGATPANKNQYLELQAVVTNELTWRKANCRSIP